MVVMIILCMVNLRLTDHHRTDQLVHPSTCQDCHRPVEGQGFILHSPASQPRAGQTAEEKPSYLLGAKLATVNAALSHSV